MLGIEEEIKEFTKLIKNAILNLEVIFLCRAKSPNTILFFGTVIIRKAFEKSKEPLDFQNKQPLFWVYEYLTGENISNSAAFMVADTAVVFWLV